METFIEELKNLCARHEVILSGNLRFLSADKFEHASMEFKETVNYGIITDRTGPFLYFTAQEKPQPVTEFGKSGKLVIQDKDRLLRDGVKSPVDRKTYGNRAEWGEMLKRHDCVEMGNDMKLQENRKPEARDMQGNFNVRPAMIEAMREVLNKPGVRK